MQCQGLTRGVEVLQENGHCGAFLLLRVAAAVNLRTRMFTEPFWLEKTLHVTFIVACKQESTFGLLTLL